MPVVGIISGKGGVGKTTTTANLSAALASFFGKRVLAVDCNPGSPDLSLHLGVYQHGRPRRPGKMGIVHLTGGLHMMPAVAYGRAEKHLTRRKIRALGYDFVLLDGPPVDYDRVLRVSDSVLVVTNPEVTAVADAIRAIKRAAEHRVPVAGVEVNCIRGFRDKSFYSKLSRIFEAPILAVVPESPRMLRCVTDGTPVVLRYPNCGASIEFRRLAARLAGVKYEAGFFWRLASSVYR